MAAPIDGQVQSRSSNSNSNSSSNNSSSSISKVMVHQAMGESPSTPPRSRTSSTSSRSSRSPKLSLDLSDLPPLSQPAPPSNTLLVTNLQDPAIFAPTTLAHVRELISQHSPAGIHTFAPLRGLQRIIISFPDTESAITIRSLLDGESLFGSRIRVYFGEPTPIEALSEKERHLQAPKSSKQFFISPPPSPPHGWESKDEDPPNKQVHADDLASALDTLSKRKEAVDTTVVPRSSSPSKSASRVGRSRSSTLVYDPEAHGKSPDLPAIAVEDTGYAFDGEEEEGGEDYLNEEEARAPESDEEMSLPIRMQKTSRPPVELMNEAQ